MVKRTFAKRGSMPKTAMPSALIEQRPFQSTLHRSPIQTQAEEQADLQTQLAIAQCTTPNWSQMTVGGTPSIVQTKLTVGAPGDQYEQEADRVADQVMSMPDSAIQQPVQREANLEEDEVQTKPIAASITPLVQREAMPEEEEVQTKANTLQREEMPEEEEVQTKAIAGTLQREEMPEEEEVQTKSLGSIQREGMPEEEEVQTKPLQRSPDGSLQAGSSIESRLNSSKGGGEPLSDEVRSFMEPRFGADFSQVRVHTGNEAIQMNRDLNAQAFTHKQDVYFGAGKTPGKDALTAHELTHVVQQTGTTKSSPHVQRDETAEDLNQKYEGAKIAARASGDWSEAAKYLNGFSQEDILQRLGWNAEELYAIYRGALNNPLVGPESQVARLAKVRYLDISIKNAQKAGNWKTASEFLNGFNDVDILNRLKDLNSVTLLEMYEGGNNGGYERVIIPSLKILSSQGIKVFPGAKLIRDPDSKVPVAYTIERVIHNLEGQTVAEEPVESTISPLDFIPFESLANIVTVAGKFGIKAFAKAASKLFAKQAPKDAGALYGAAIKRVLAAPASQRIGLWEQLAKQIELSPQGQASGWKGAQKMILSDESTVFFGSKGPALVFDKKGNVFRGAIANPEHFAVGESGLLPHYNKLTKLN